LSYQQTVTMHLEVALLTTNILTITQRERSICINSYCTFKI